MKAVRVAFLFQGRRQRVLEEVSRGEASDMPLYGTNHIARELADSYACEWIDFAGIWKSFWHLRRFDIVFTSIGLSVLILQRLLLLRQPRWVFFNINLSTKLSGYSRYSPKRALMLSALRRADTIICLSSAQRTYLAAAGVRAEKLELVSYGTDKTFFTPSPADDGYVLSVGRDLGRDYRTLFAAASRIDAQFLVVAGKRNIDGEGITEIPPNVTLLYGKPWAEYRSLLQKARVVVVPLKKGGARDASDCSGQTVALDALATGKPIVISKMDWTPDYLEAGDNALLPPPGDAQALAEAVQELLDDTKLRQRFGVVGRESVEHTFNTERMGRKIADIIKVLQARRS